MELRIGYFYPDELNLYADRGNVICLTRRCRWRGIDVQVVPVELKERFDPDEFDILILGGGQDRDQRVVADDLVEIKGEALRAAVESGVVVLAACAAYQLLGHYYQPAEGDRIRGLGIFDAYTVHPGPAEPRCIGNIVVEWQGRTLVGFENHGGRTVLGPGATPLGRVVVGFGNNGLDGTEGAVYKSAFGTYMHGSLLPKNPHFADHLIWLALKRRYADVTLAPLDDRLELAAHQAAIQRARAGD
jgi:CobQ-like glutamine amidotransferase family enzyme